MKLLKFSLALCLALSATFVFGQGQPIPNVNVKTLDGQTVNLKDTYGVSKDKITVISFWATWCKPCQRELDAIADLYPDWQDEYDVELVAITIDTRRMLSQVPGLVATKGWEYTILAGNDQDLQTAFNFNTIPQTFVVDRNGNIIYTHNGYSPGDEEELEDIIAEADKE